MFLVSGRASLVKLVDFQIVRESNNNKVFEPILTDGSLLRVWDYQGHFLLHILGYRFGIIRHMYYALGYCDGR